MSIDDHNINDAQQGTTYQLKCLLFEGEIPRLDFRVIQQVVDDGEKVVGAPSKNLQHKESSLNALHPLNERGRERDW